tara:strand:- start:31 stop:393 length:363 start_codon:yes stop_codon:yes gene_type:complete
MKTVMLYALLFALLLVPASTVSNSDPSIDSGIYVVEFNASFNAQNSVPWIESITECNPLRVDIGEAPDMQKEHKIVVVPTIIVFSEGEEIERFQANIMMTMEATPKEVQEVVDEIILSDF